jgi:hypothetical protein
VSFTHTPEHIMFGFLSNVLIVSASTATLALGALTGGAPLLFAGLGALLANVVRNHYL